MTTTDTTQSKRSGPPEVRSRSDDRDSADSETADRGGSPDSDRAGDSVGVHHGHLDTEDTDPVTPHPLVARNEVLLRGRVAAAAESRELPSGDVLVTIRLIVDRDPAAHVRSRQRVDTIDCVAWQRRPQRSLRSWAPGDLVEVSGAIRRRFFRAATGPVSRVEVEVAAARRLGRETRSSRS